MITSPKEPYRGFQKGQVANPAGRPKGSRQKVATLFFDNLYEIWQEQGDAVLRRAAFEQPTAFAAMVAKLMPQKIELSHTTNGMSDERYAELLELLEGAKRHALASVSAPSLLGAPAGVLIDEGGPPRRDEMRVGGTLVPIHYSAATDGAAHTTNIPETLQADAVHSNLPVEDAEIDEDEQDLIASLL